MIEVVARSVSRPVREWLFAADQKPRTGQVWATFERACYLEPADGDLVALVLPSIGDGPLNVVVNGNPEVFAGASPGMPVHLADRYLQVGALEVDLKGARVWEPRPDWETLRAHRASIAARLLPVLTFALACAPKGSLLVLLAGSSAHPSDVSMRGVFFGRALPAAQGLRSGWGNHGEADGWTGECRRESLERLRAGAAQLAGLGGGLTPAGDDFLTGAMLWAWLAHRAPEDYCAALLSASMTQTTMLSAALLRAAAQGECSAPWHDLLKALACGSDADVAQAVHDVLAHGHTSGADALAGFLWMQSG